MPASAFLQAYFACRNLSVTEMGGGTFNCGAERQYPAEWTAVLIRNICGVERALESSRS